MMIDYLSMGERVFNARKARGLTQEELAEKAMLSHTYISYIENGEKCMSLKSMILLANALNVSADEILQDSLRNVTKMANKEFSSLLKDCNEYEIRVLLDIVRKGKESMRQHRGFLIQENY